MINNIIKTVEITLEYVSMATFICHCVEMPLNIEYKLLLHVERISDHLTL